MNINSEFNLQFFADGDAATNGDGGNVNEPEKKFTQADMDRVVKERVDRLGKRYADYDELKKTNESLKETGLSLEEIFELRNKREEEVKTKLEQKGDYEKLLAKVNEKNKQLLDAKAEEVRKMRSALESYLVDAAATQAIASEKGIPQLLLPHVKSSVKVFEEEGKYQVRILGPDGSPRVNAKGDYLGIKDLVTEMKSNDIFGRAFEGTGAGGGGAPSGGSPSGGNGFVLSRTDAEDPMKYRAAKEAAQKAGHSLQIAPE